jgi:hypothetical protein
MNIGSKLIKLIYITLLIGLSACGRSIDPTFLPNINTPTTPSQEVVITPKPTQGQASTPTMPSKTVTPSIPPTRRPTRTPTPGKVVYNPQCVFFVQEFDQDIGLNGVLVFRSLNDPGNLVLIDLKTESERTVPGAGGDISPGKNILASYLDTQGANGKSGKFTVIFLRSNGEKIQSITFDGKNSIHYRAGYWINDRTYLIRQDFEGVEDDTFFALDYREGIKNEVQPHKLPDFDVFWENYAWVAPAAYSPSQELVAYPALGLNQTPLVLWDLVEEREVSRFDDFLVSPFDMPIWLPDGSKFIFLQDQRTQRAQHPEALELFGMDTAGNVNRLTYLTNTHSPVSISNYSVSPQSDKVAFWLSGGSKQDFLVILDLTTQRILDTCIDGFSEASPAWSPDGQWIMIEKFDKEMNNGQLFLVDTTTGETFLYREIGNRLLLGWMAEP